jgi:hypothetical protein
MTKELEAEIAKVVEALGGIDEVMKQARKNADESMVKADKIREITGHMSAEEGDAYILDLVRSADVACAIWREDDTDRPLLHFVKDASSRWRTTSVTFWVKNKAEALAFERKANAAGVTKPLM